MAKFTPGAIISEIRGSIADVTYSRSSAGAIAKKKLVQTNPNSPEQIAARALQASAVAAWQALPQTERDAWIVFADSQTSKPRIDGTHKLGGYNAFIRFYITRNTYGLAGNPSRILQEPTGVYNQFASIVSDETIQLTLTGNNNNADIQVVARASGPVSAGISSISQSAMTIMSFQQSPNGQVIIDITPEWVAKWGDLVSSLGQKVFLRLDIVNRITAQRVVVFRTSGLIGVLNTIVAVASSGNNNRVMISNNGIGWVTTVNPDDQNWSSVAYSSALGLFAAVCTGASNPKIMTSPDGINWTSVVQGQTIDYQSVIWSANLGLFVAVASSGPPFRTLTSPDGVTWSIGLASSSIQWQSLTYAPSLNLLVAVALDGAGIQTMSSSNGTAWVNGFAVVANQWTSITWSPELLLFVAVAQTGAGNRVMSSTDGSTWTIRVSPVDNDWQSVAWSPELLLFVAVSNTGSGDRVMTSPDGVVWSTQASAANVMWQSVIWVAPLGLFIACAISGGGNRIMTSPDGLVWSSQSSAANNSWMALAFK